LKSFFPLRIQLVATLTSQLKNIITLFSVSCFPPNIPVVFSYYSTSVVFKVILRTSHCASCLFSHSSCFLCFYIPPFLCSSFNGLSLYSIVSVFFCLHLFLLSFHQLPPQFLFLRYSQARFFSFFCFLFSIN
jgi:hypothetical protein